jgi:hypothetical protein
MGTDIDGGEQLTDLVGLTNKHDSALFAYPDAIGVLKAWNLLEI